VPCGRAARVRPPARARPGRRRRGLGLTRCALWVFDFGAPIGLRVAERNPGWIAGLIVRNGNAYADGLSQAARDLIAQRPDTPGGPERVHAEPTLEAVRARYLTGVPDPSLVAPGNWTLDHHFLNLPGHREAQAALLFGNRIAVCEETDGYYVYRLNGTTERLVEMDGQTRGLAALTNGRAVVATSQGLFIHDAFGQTVATIGEGASFGMIGETSNYRLN